MAWNEPGNNGNKNNDPWKNKGGRDQGPPDLDEVFRKYSDKLGGMFGGNGGGNNKGGSNLSGICLLYTSPSPRDS